MQQENRVLSFVWTKPAGQPALKSKRSCISCCLEHLAKSLFTEAPTAPSVSSPSQLSPHPGASLGASSCLLASAAGALACHLSWCFFLPHSFKIGLGAWASGEDTQISGYVLVLHPSICYLTLWFLGWIMGLDSLVPGLDHGIGIRARGDLGALRLIAFISWRGKQKSPWSQGGWPLLCGTLHQHRLLHDHPAERDGAVPSDRGRVH